MYIGNGRLGYEFCIHRPIYHNGEFMTNGARWVTVHADNDTKALSLIELKGEEVKQVTPTFELMTGPEYIYSVECLGKVTWEKVPHYEKRP